MAEEGEACASIHLAFDHLGFRVDSFGAAVRSSRRLRMNR